MGGRKREDDKTLEKGLPARLSSLFLLSHTYAAGWRSVVSKFCLVNRQRAPLYRERASGELHGCSFTARRDVVFESRARHPKKADAHVHARAEQRENERNRRRLRELVACSGAVRRRKYE